LEQVCRSGRCEMSEAVRCNGSAMCSENQRCIPTSDNDGHCAPLCQADAECPLHRECDPMFRACVYRACGRDSGNGVMLSQCVLGSQDQLMGTCLPLGGNQRDNDTGYCAESGTSGQGEPCDAQAVSRSAESRAAQCHPGSLCFGDPDDPLEPVLEHLGRGACRDLCNSQQARCGEGLECVDFDEGEAALGLCVPSDCVVFSEDSCVDDLGCVPFSWWSARGTCQPVGQALPGQFCSSAQDCLRPSLCVNQQAGPVCISICNGENTPCMQGQCFQEPSWSFGVCL
jgi:hypothetical protein